MWIPKIEGKDAVVVHAKTGIKRRLNCGGFKGAKAVSLAGDSVVVQTGDGRTKLWNPDTGTIRNVN
jgi:hypothetical protein